MPLAHPSPTSVNLFKLKTSKVAATDRKYRPLTTSGCHEHRIIIPVYAVEQQ
jgi:hypothetical protein